MGSGYTTSPLLSTASTIAEELLNSRSDCGFFTPRELEEAIAWLDQLEANGGFDPATDRPLHTTSFEPLAQTTYFDFA